MASRRPGAVLLDEAGRLDRGKDLRLGLPLREGRRRGRRVGSVAADVGDPGRVPGLDRQDRAGRGQYGLRLDVSDLAEVGTDPGVFELLGGRFELGLVRGRALEVEPRLRDRLGAKRRLERSDVGGLMGGHQPGELLRLPVQRPLRDGFGIERRLEILEGKSEVEDRNVAGADPSRRYRRQRTQERATAGKGCDPEAGLLQEVGAAPAKCFLSRLRDCPVNVNISKKERF